MRSLVQKLKPLEKCQFSNYTYLIPSHSICPKLFWIFAESIKIDPFFLLSSRVYKLCRGSSYIFGTTWYLCHEGRDDPINPIFDKHHTDILSKQTTLADFLLTLHKWVSTNLLKFLIMHQPSELWTSLDENQSIPWN